MTQQKGTKSRIPEFASYQEEAEFWDTHDTTDFEDEFLPIDLKIDGPIRHLYTIPVEHETMRVLDEIAAERRIGPMALAAEWLQERANDEASRRPSPSAGKRAKGSPKPAPKRRAKTTSSATAR